MNVHGGECVGGWEDGTHGGRAGRNGEMANGEQLNGEQLAGRAASRQGGGGREDGGCRGWMEGG